MHGNAERSVVPAISSENAAGSGLVDRVERAMAEVVSIYDLLYPHQNTRIIFREGADPIGSVPKVVMGPFTMGPEHIGPDYLGQVTRKADTVLGPDITVLAAIPRAPTPGEIRDMDRPWDPRRLKPLFALKPLLYEHIRYLVELRRKGKSRARHSHAVLPRGAGLAELAPRPDQTAAPDKRPSIIVGFHWLEVGGAEKLAFDSVKWALAAGFRVIVLASNRSLHRLADRLPDDPNVRFVRADQYLPEHLWPDFVSRLIETENVRVIHIHHCIALYQCLPQIKGCYPWVLTIDSTHIIEYADGGYPRISGVWSDFIDIQHVISNDLGKYFRDVFHNIGKIRLGRMLKRAPDRTPRALPALNMSAGQKSLHVSFVGRLYYQKRPIVVVETMRALARWANGVGVSLSGSFVGEGPFEDAVRALLRRYGLADKVEMMPANSDVPAILSKSDILLLPSNNEGLALVCYEAIEQGCIPISTDVGAQKEVLPPSLLVPLAPFQSVRQATAIVDRLWRSADTLSIEQAKLQEAWHRLERDPTAEEVLTKAYRAVLADVHDLEEAVS